MGGTVVPPCSFNTLGGRVPLMGKLLFDDKSGGEFRIKNSLSSPLDKASRLATSVNISDQFLVTEPPDSLVGSMRDGY